MITRREYPHMDQQRLDDSASAVDLPASSPGRRQSHSISSGASDGGESAHNSDAGHLALDLRLLLPLQPRRAWTVEDVRKRALESDPDAYDVGPHAVTCRSCHRSIRLNATGRYYAANWNKHKASCRALQSGTIQEFRFSGRVPTFRLDKVESGGKGHDHDVQDDHTSNRSYSRRSTIDISDSEEPAYGNPYPPPPESSQFSERSRRQRRTMLYDERRSHDTPPNDAESRDYRYMHEPQSSRSIPPLLHHTPPMHRSAQRLLHETPSPFPSPSPSPSPPPMLRPLRNVDNSRSQGQTSLPSIHELTSQLPSPSIASQDSPPTRGSFHPGSSSHAHVAQPVSFKNFLRASNQDANLGPVWDWSKDRRHDR